MQRPDDDGPIPEFDQTNGVVAGLDGDSDGTRRGDTESDIEQRREDFDGRTANTITGGIGSHRL